MKLNVYTVLIIDNNADMRRLHHHVLDSKVKGCKILETATLTESRELLETERLDLIIMEVVLPDGSGFDFCKKAKEKNIPVIIMTELLSGHHILDGFSAGCNYYMIKDDYDPDILEAIIKRLLSGEQTSDEFSLMQTKFKLYKEEQKKNRNITALDDNIMDNVAGGNFTWSQSAEATPSSSDEDPGIGSKPKGATSFIK